MPHRCRRRVRPVAEPLELRELLTLAVVDFDTGASQTATNSGHLVSVPINFFDGSASVADHTGHGTAMADLVSRTLAGVTQDFQVWSLKCDDGTGILSDLAISRAASWVANLHRAMPSLALAAEWSFSAPQSDPVLMLAAQTLHDAGIPIAAAAGNGLGPGQEVSNNNDLTPVYPASLPFANLLAVADTTAEGQLEPYSNYGPNTVPIAARAAGLGTSGAAAIGAAWLAVESAAYPLVPGQDPGDYAARIVRAVESAATPNLSLSGTVTTGGELLGVPHALPITVPTAPPSPTPTPALPSSPTHTTALPSSPTHAKVLPLGPRHAFAFGRHRRHHR
jgi:Subtilase family